MPQRFVTVVETALFVRQAEDVWDDAEREAFVTFPRAESASRRRDPRYWRRAESPLGAGGNGETWRRARDLLLSSAHRPLYLLMVYAKARRDNLTPAEKKAVPKLATTLKG